MKVAQLQTHVFTDKKANLTELESKLEQLEGQGIDLVTLGEMFNCPYETGMFPKYAEKEGGESWQFCSILAKKHHIYLAAGSMPEVDDAGNVYNTAYVFDREGNQIAKHRKVHLFDIDIEGGQTFKESDTLAPGNHYTVFDTEFGKIGMMICFDIRFPELSRLMVQDGAKVILVPAAFNMTTGPAHWELSFRARALDNQCYFIGTSGARDENASYHAWGHSIFVSPWGEVVGELDEKEGMMVNEVNLDYIDKIRQELPLLKARRLDLYELKSK